MDKPRHGYLNTQPPPVPGPDDGNVAQVVHAQLSKELLPDDITLAAISAEVLKARLKFPGNRFLLAALTEELGELARAMLQNKSRDDIQREAIQVAAVAARIIEEGDATFDDIKPEESLA